MTDLKLRPGEIKVLQALRAGPMENSELLDRFPGGFHIQKLLKQGLVLNGKFGYQLTEQGRAICPTRRSTEKADYLPKPSTNTVTPATSNAVKTIGLNAVKLTTIKQPEVPMPAHTNVATLIRDTIKAHPGIEHDALIKKITNNATESAAIKKATDMITYTLRAGGFTKCDDYVIGTNQKLKLYYTDEDYQKKLEKAGAKVANVIPTLAQHHAAQPPKPKKEPSMTSSAPEQTTKQPVISITFAIQLPEMPDKLKLIGLKKSSLDDAIASGDSYTIDVATLDDIAIDAICTQWAQKFKAHVQERKQQ